MFFFIVLAPGQLDKTVKRENYSVKWRTDDDDDWLIMSCIS